ncbi:MAG TPA: flagellar motor switch protein FliG [candidate division Zixibacteria bacterium]|nr:flagellar motor switch protein FliG [candidate division Zixibacteria bacterium]
MKGSDAKQRGRNALSGPEKAAIFLAVVGEELATSLAGELQEKELVMLRQGVGRMAQIAPEDIEEVLEDTCRYLKKANIFAEGTSEYLQRVLNKAVGPEKAAAILSRIFQEDADDSAGIDALHEMDAKTLAQFLQNEQPQTVAFILAHLYPAHAGEIFALLSEDKQAEVAFRIARLTSISPGAIEEVTKVLRNEIRHFQGKQVGGLRAVAEILNFVDNATEERVMAGLGGFEAELPESIRQLMFTFEDLAKIDDQSMQVLVREVEKDKWVMAMRTASPNLKKKIFGSMSERASALLKEEIESMGPVRLRDVEAAQRDIIDLARRLESEGKIYLSAGKAKEDVLV